MVRDIPKKGLEHIEPIVVFVMHRVTFNYSQRKKIHTWEN